MGHKLPQKLDNVNTVHCMQVEDLGTIVYATFARNQFGFDIYAVDVNTIDGEHAERFSKEAVLTDGISINFNGAFNR